MRITVIGKFFLLLTIFGCATKEQSPGQGNKAIPKVNTEMDAFKENQMLSTPSQENIIAALKESGIYIYNINLPKIDLSNYELVIHRETYLKGVKSTDPGYPLEEQLKATTYNNPQNQYNLVFSLINKNDSLFIESWQLPTGNRTAITTKKDLKHFLDFNATPFKSQTIVPDKKIPVLLFGSSWKDEKTGYLRYCMERELDHDFSSEAFKNMPGYYVYSVELRKK